MFHILTATLNNNLFSESGASSNKCSDTYMGPEPFSEVEYRNIRDYVLALEPTPILAHALHSYSQLWLYPYGYAHNALPDNWEEIVSFFYLQISSSRNL